MPVYICICHHWSDIRNDFEQVWYNNGSINELFSTLKQNYKPIKMFDKLKQLNKNIDAWMTKKQGNLTKGQHLIVILFCFLYFGIATSYRDEGEEQTFFNYLLPFICLVCIGGQFSLNAIIDKKYKKKE